MDLKQNSDTWVELSTIFVLCDDIIRTAEDIDTLYQYISNAYIFLAMVDYPYPDSFLMPLPAWPVNASCEFFKDINTTTEASQKANAGELTPR